MNMWHIRLQVLADGGVTIAETSYGIPAGEIDIRGHDDGNKVVLEARQRDRDGQYVISAHHRRDRMEEALLHEARAEAAAIEGERM